MLQSRLFSKTTKNLPEGETAKNAQLLIKGGFINKSSAGVYSFLPLGLRVLNKINQIIREEMNAIDAEELLFPALVHKKYWEQSDRWNTEVAYKTGEHPTSNPEHLTYGLGWTHEEAVSAIAQHFIQSYKDLPKAVYQIQTKFRNEPRAQAGLLRGREFLMKDLYSFHATKDDLEQYYKTVMAAYQKIFQRLGLEAMVTEAGGGAFTKEFTHEFQVLNPAGEDTVYYCKKCGFSQNKEIYNAAAHKNCREEIQFGSAIEVGNIFRLGTRFSEPFKLFYLDQNGQSNPVIMGSYGIGPSRAMGAIVEERHDAKGIIWPEAAAPFLAHLTQLGESPAVAKAARELYKTIGQKMNWEVLYDERMVSAGEKLNDADLLGIPWRLVVSEKTVAAKKVEIKKRSEKEAALVSPSQIFKYISI